MSQYTINIGALPNDGTGDPLRTAFNETNLNFNQIFAAGPVLSNVQIANNTILTTNTNGNLILAPNGTAVVQSNVSIVPNLANLRNLGSSTQRWNTVYAQYLNVSVFEFPGNISITGNISAGNILSNNYYYANGQPFVSGGVIQANVAPVGPTENTLWWDEVSGRLYIWYNDGVSTQWVDASPASGFGGASGTINLTQISSDIIPVTSNAYSLGNSTYQWNNLYANNIGSNAIVATGNITTTANISGGYILGNGSQLTGLAATYGNANVAAYLPTYSGNIAGGNIGVSGAVNAVGEITSFANLVTTGEVQATGNIIGDYFIGNGSQLTGITTSAAGSNTQIQFNNAGAFGADADFYFASTTNTLVVNGNLGEHSVELGSTGFTELNANVIAQITGNVNSYTQVNFQNINSGNRATTDYIATSAFGTDSTFFVDMGIASNSYDQTNPNNSLGTALYPQDSYLYAQGGNNIGGSGGNLVVGSNEPGGVVRLIANGSNTANIVATFSNSGIDVLGNIIPVTSNVYSLGNATNQWSDLYVSNATIYMNNIPVSLTSGNVLTVDGNAVVTTNTEGQANIGNIGIGGTTIYIADGAEETIISISPDIEGQAYIQVPNDATANVANVRIHNDAGNIEFGTNASSYLWHFTNLGGTVFPTLDVQRGDVSGGTIQGQTLLFGDGDQEAIISTPNAPAGSGGNSQRLVINPGQGDGAGEGGDIYLWAGRGGDTDGNGGDVKIRGGYGPGSGPGGYIRMDGGDSAGTGDAGFIEITGGTGGDTVGGYVRIQGGVGATSGGDANIAGGYGGDVVGGNVNIAGGQSGGGLPAYGNINIYAGISGWVFNNNGNLTLPNGDNITNGGWYGTASSTVSLNAVSPDGNTVSFQAQGNSSLAVIQTYSDGTDTEYSWALDNTGNLTLPQGGIVYETNIPFGGLEGKTIALKPYGGTDADQQLLVYPTAGADFNHLHLTTGNLWNTEMFLGNDDFYVKLANTGNVVINTNDNGGNTYQLNFTPFGEMRTTGSLFIQTPNGVPNGVTAITGSSGSWESNPRTDLATTNGTGAGLTVTVTETGGYASAIAIVNPGSGYANGDEITVTSGSSSATFTISVANNQWILDTEGELTLPTISLGSGLNEQTVISSQRKLIPPFRWSAEITGTTPTVVYTATDVQTTSMKVTMQIQHSGVGMEFFEVFATESANDTYYTVSNRVAPPTIDASTVVVSLNGSNEMQITVTINSGAGTSWVTYDAVEFGIPND